MAHTDLVSPDDRLYADPHDSLGFLTRIAFRRFSRALEKRTLKEGVSAGQWRFLRVLWRGDGITQRELSHQVGATEPTTVTAMKSLERSGFIIRGQSNDDRRRTYVFLTPKARKLHDLLLPDVAEVNRIACKDMSEDETATLRRLLVQAIANLAEGAEEGA